MLMYISVALKNTVKYRFDCTRSLVETPLACCNISLLLRQSSSMVGSAKFVPLQL